MWDYLDGLFLQTHYYYVQEVLANKFLLILSIIIAHINEVLIFVQLYEIKKIPFFGVH